VSTFEFSLQIRPPPLLLLLLLLLRRRTCGRRRRGQRMGGLGGLKTGKGFEISKGNSFQLPKCPQKYYQHSENVAKTQMPMAIAIAKCMEHTSIAPQTEKGFRGHPPSKCAPPTSYLVKSTNPIFSKN